MPRPPLPVGAHGKINVREVRPGVFEARCRFRDTDGFTRPVSKVGETAAAAERELKAELTRRKPPSKDEIQASTRLHVLAGRWLITVGRDPGLKQASRDRYVWAVEKVVVPGLGGLELRECTPGRVNDFLQRVVVERGASTARTARVCLSAMLGLAVRLGALAVNPVAGAEQLPVPMREPKALTPAQTTDLMRKLRRDKVAVQRDLPDLVEAMLGTGMRIGEAIALLADDVDLEKGTIHVLATVTDRGRQAAPKTDAGRRVLKVPAHVVELLRRRIENPRIRTDVAVFCSPWGRLRNRRNTSSDLREAFNAAGYPWVTSHTLRKTCATRLDDAKLTAVEIAAYLGHRRPSMTQDLYVAKRSASSRPSEVLMPP